MSDDLLPWLDEHTITVAAGPEALWQAAALVFARSFSRGSSARYARIVRAEPCAKAWPWPPAEGSTVPGFRVMSAVPGRDLALAGRHRFSDYTLVFRIEPLGPALSRLRAESRAAFPGAAGRGYRMLVIGTGAHVLGMRRLLAAIRRQAEATAS
ncbi:hypothetical protein [Microbispora sp. ATCC PTA-5024]|uniref:hypothetical protein n=1 Tax=Microbispora sp. ATCC PTA-5024 TaxID=316330 RepID=UPI0003DD522E|nr:hypothetical protein [Microbispora sp. ATCC PTA-5024]ETK37767.1 hypothetical protein MPTA5024_02205 [Microbispora sp. ATCC PTA-5024]